MNYLLDYYDLTLNSDETLYLILAIEGSEFIQMEDLSKRARKDLSKAKEDYDEGAGYSFLFQGEDVRLILIALAEMDEKANQFRIETSIPILLNPGTNMNAPDLIKEFQIQKKTIGFNPFNLILKIRGKEIENGFHAINN